jgi:tRNA(Ser,Leu) C12 N-acetylase TAN1
MRKVCGTIFSRKIPKNKTLAHVEKKRGDLHF